MLISGVNLKNKHAKPWSFHGLRCFTQRDDKHWCDFFVVRLFLDLKAQACYQGHYIELIFRFFKEQKIWQNFVQDHLKSERIPQ